MLMVAIKNHNGATIKMLRDSHHKCLRSSATRYIAFFMMIVAPPYDCRTIRIEFTLIFFTIMIKCRSHYDNCRPTLNLYFIMEFKLFASKF